MSQIIPKCATGSGSYNLIHITNVVHYEYSVQCTETDLTFFAIKNWRCKFELSHFQSFKNNLFASALANIIFIVLR